MHSRSKSLRFVLIAGLLLLPVACNSSTELENAQSNVQPQTTPDASEAEKTPDVESQLLAENAEGAESDDRLSESSEPLTIEVKDVTPQVSFTRVAPATVEVVAVEEEPLEAETKAASATYRPVQKVEAEEEKKTEAKPAAPAIRRPSRPEVADIDEKATHYHAGLIEVSKGSSDPHRLNAFCLDGKGQIVAACGEGPGEIRILDAEGKLLDSWEVDIKPEAVNVAEDGTVLVGGHGKLMRFSSEGKLMASADAPHADAIRKGKEKMREEVVQQLKSRTNSLASRVRSYESIIAQLKKRKEEGKLGEQEERILASLPKTLETMKKQLEEQGETEEPKISDSQIESRLKYMIDRKMRVSSISSDSDHVYIATYAVEGYGFNVWQLDQDFQNGKVVVDGLRGCCGQMDVQVNDDGIYVAENARFRVACFKPDGELKTSWGKGDRTGADGFTSCCNPMNVCFSKGGDVFTAESNTGRIKRFSPDGKLIDFIGDVKLVPGCKNVSIAVSPEGDRVYMLDITRNHIVLMKKKSEKPEEEKNPKVTLND